MKESKIMLIQYITGIFILVLGALHFLAISALAPTSDKVLYQYANNSTSTHTLTGGTLYYTTVTAIYHTLFWGSIFELLLTFLVFHIFNGFRIILSEQFPGDRSEKAITYIMLVAGLIIFIWGSKTVVTMLLGGGL